jgi:hypothetical protein
MFRACTFLLICFLAACCLTKPLHSLREGVLLMGPSKTPQSGGRLGRSFADAKEKNKCRPFMYILRSDPSHMDSRNKATLVSLGHIHNDKNF